MTASTTRFRTRALVLTGVIAVALVTVVARLAHLQLIQHHDLSSRADRQYSKTLPLRPQRGPIFDRTGKALAVSGEVESVFALPGRIADRAAVAERLGAALGERPREVLERLTTDRPFVWIKRKIPPGSAQTVRALKLPGVGTLPEALRFYPNRELAAHVLGFVGFDDRGLEGLELGHNDLLAGAPGLALVERDALGREVTAQPTILKQPTSGRGLVLTLDATIQYIAERELDQAWRSTGANAGMVLVMDPRSGEILAMAIRPTFNPNVYQGATATEWRNRALTDPFEPGSTFKAILAAAALQEKVIRPDDRLYAEQGVITVANKQIHDWKKYGWLTFREVLKFSSNVGSIKVGLALGRERYYQHMTGFGFGALTGIDLPGESRGLLRAPARWSGLSLATMSIGQEVSVTAVQILSAFAAIANQGRLMQPHVVRAYLDERGQEVRRVEPQPTRQVIAPETAQTLTEILTAVVADGTGHKAYLEGYPVAGKTGTAQKRDPHSKSYSRKPGVLSFVGFVPAHDPRLAILTLLDEPKTVVWGSEAAAPIFGAVAGQVLHYLDLPPSQGTPAVQIVRGMAAPAEPATVPLLAIETDGDSPVMPDVTGRSLRQALTLLAPYDLDVTVSGRGTVVRQTPPSGSAVTAGAFVRLELAPQVAQAGGALRP
jgi:cell division protein FtsI (penicillin-binding protein 3)